MACATMKRSLDFDPLHNQPSKRQRCVISPMVISPSSSPPATRSETPTPSNSVFAGLVPKISQEMMVAGIREEIRRMHRKKQLHFNPKLTESHSQDSSSDSPGSPTASFMAACSVMPDKPLFTFRQVGIICERLINERENQIREEYDRFLNMKLSEQYEAFNQFSNDQLHRRFEMGTAPSYLS